MPINEVEELRNRFISQLMPISIYLFGSYAADSYSENSDLDFYIVVNDNVADLAALTTQAYRSIRRVKTHPVDIIVGTKSRFDSRKIYL